MLVASGSYTGNATIRSITGAGFAPDLVLVKNTATTDDTWFRTAAMAANNSIPIRSDAGLATGRITSLDADGFSVGTDAAANGNTNTIAWLAVKDNGAGDFGVFNYTGDATDDKLVFTSFQPDFAVVKADSGLLGATKYVGQASALANAASNDAFPNYPGAPTSPDLIGFFSDGLRVSSLDALNIININATAHYGFAFKAAAGKCAAGSYVGDDVNGRTITTNVNPSFISVRRSSGTFVNMFSSQMGSGNTLAWDSAQSTGKISSVTSTGFVVTDEGNVNDTGLTYYWLAVGVGSAVNSGFFNLF